jgi:alkylation response protein AidB-like acyl-CoA dehydrogenase
VISLGVAAAGMELARRAVIDRGRAGNAEVQRAFAEMEVLLETARAVLYRHAHEIGAYDRGAQLSVVELYARGNLAKYVACQNAIAIMDRVMEVSGGVGYHRRFPIERLYRDVRAGAIMPYSSPDARALFAQEALGIEPAPVNTEDGLARLLAGLR